MAFFNSAVDVLQTLVVALGAGLGIWGVINLMEGYGNDNPGANAVGMKHRPHDTRHTCVSLLTVAGVSDKVIKKIVGHKGQGVTEIVYTHFEIAELIDAINKI